LIVAFRTMKLLAQLFQHRAMALGNAHASYNLLESSFYLSPKLLLDQVEECFNDGAAYLSLLQELAGRGSLLGQQPRCGTKEPAPVKVLPFCIRPPPGLELPLTQTSDETDTTLLWASDATADLLEQDPTRTCSHGSIHKRRAAGTKTSAPQSNQKPKSAKAAKKKQKEPLSELQPLPPGPCVGQAAQGGAGGHSGVSRKATCKFSFVGYNCEKHKDFDLVPRLIGREGCNMRAIATDDCKVRIRGRASAHFDVLRNGVAREADTPLQIALSCSNEKELEVAKQKVETLLSNISVHFYRCCRKMGWTPPAQLYKLI